MACKHTFIDIDVPKAWCEYTTNPKALETDTQGLADVLQMADQQQGTGFRLIRLNSYIALLPNCELVDLEIQHTGIYRDAGMVVSPSASPRYARKDKVLHPPHVPRKP
jgi:hypothetical protein